MFTDTLSCKLHSLFVGGDLEAAYCNISLGFSDISAIINDLCTTLPVNYTLCVSMAYLTGREHMFGQPVGQRAAAQGASHSAAAIAGERADPL